MKQFSIVHVLVLLAFLSVCLGWYSSELQKRKLIVQHEKAVETLIGTIQEEHVRDYYPTVGELTEIVGTNVDSYPELRNNAKHSILDPVEFLTILRGKKTKTGLMQTMQNFEEVFDADQSISVYTLDLNHPDNFGGDDMFFVYSQNGLILMAYRTVDETDW